MSWWTDAIPMQPFSFLANAHTHTHMHAQQYLIVEFITVFSKINVASSSKLNLSMLVHYSY